MGSLRKDATSNDVAGNDGTFRLVDFEVDPAALRIAGADGKAVKVESKAMQVLLELVRSAGRVVTRQDLEAAVWSGRLVSEDALTNAIGKLRKAFNDSARSPRIIETVPKHGYRLLVKPQLHRPAKGPFFTARWHLVPVTLLVLAGMVGALYFLHFGKERTQQMATAPAPVTVAVLPFAALTANVEEFLAIGLAQDLINDLSVQPHLQLIAAKSTFSIDPSVREPGVLSQLGAHYVVSGTVAKAGNNIQIEIRLWESSSGKQLWSDRVEGPERNLFDLQRDIAQELASVVAGNRDRVSRFVDRRGTTKTLAAYDEFLRGRTLYSRMTPDGNHDARIHYTNATELDPQFARAHAGLALTWVREVMDGWATDPEAALREASRHAMLAEAIDPNVPQIYFVNGLLALFRGEHLAAAEEVHRATDLDPSYADAYALLAWILQYGGRPDIAVETMNKALRLNPLSSASYDVVAGEISFTMGRYEEAVLSFRRALTRNPSHSRARLWLAASLAKSGEYVDAAWEIDELKVLNPSLEIRTLAFGFPHKDPEVPRRFYASLRQIDMLGLLAD
jgi:TolB-like protein/DNA-binding winged helix-turn-helix (wHTH) protein